MFRKSCGVCPFTNLKRPSDLTLADFWGWEKSVPDLNKDDRGISLLLINTLNGQRLFNEIKDRMIAKEVELEKCIQSRMQYPSPVDANRELFEDDYSRHGIKFVLKKYGNVGYHYELNIYKNRLKAQIMKIIRVFQ